jgi:hypothetical protein
MTKKQIAEKHLASLAIKFLEDGGRPDLLLGGRMPYKLKVLAEALEALEWNEAAGRVRTWMKRNEKRLWNVTGKDTVPK